MFFYSQFNVFNIYGYIVSFSSRNGSAVPGEQLHTNRRRCWSSDLLSASHRKLIVPRYRLNSFGRRCFAVAGPTTWNLLPDSLRDPALSLNVFRRRLKTYVFVKY